MDDLLSSIAARMERGADRLANAGDFVQEGVLREAARAIRSRRDLGEALELEKALLADPAAASSARVVAFAAAEYAPSYTPLAGNLDLSSVGQTWVCTVNSGHDEFVRRTAEQEIPACACGAARTLKRA